MQTPPMRITLGAHSLKAYVTAPKTMHVLGIVRMGMEYGLLATNEQGVFFRVNGSTAVELDPRRVRQAIEVARSNGIRAGLGSLDETAWAEEMAKIQAPRPAPRVTTRKHRHVEGGAGAWA